MAQDDGMSGMIPSAGQQGEIRRSGAAAFPPGAMRLNDYQAIEEFLQPKGPSIKDFLTLLLKRKKVILISIALCFSFGLIYAISAPSLFTATAVIEIRGYNPVLGQELSENLLQTDSRKLLYQETTTAKLSNLSLADDVLSTNGLGLEVKKYFQKQRSWFSELTSSVMKALGSSSEDNQFDEEDPRYVHREVFLDNYYKLIQVFPIHDTSLVQVRATTTDRRLSQRIANEHAEGLIRALAKERHDELSEHLNLLKSHADELQQKLATAEAQVAKYSQDHQLVEVVTDGNQGNLLFSQLNELTKQLSSARSKRGESESKVKKLNTTKKSDNTILDDETIKDLRTKLKEAESDYASLSKSVTDEYPKLIELRGKINSYRSTIKEQRDENYEALKTQYESDLAAEKLLSDQFEQQLNKAHAMSNELIQYNLLQREASSLRDLTQSVLKALNETKIGATTVQDNVFITDYAPIPGAPSAPRRTVIVLMGLLLGALAGVGLAILLEVLDSTIKVSDEAQEALGIPTLGIIPSFIRLNGVDQDEDKSWKDRLRDKIPRLTWSGGKDDTSGEITALADDATHSESNISESKGARYKKKRRTKSRPRIRFTQANLKVIDSDRSGLLAMPEAATLDALRTLRANILFSTTQNKFRVIMATSGKEREGKTSVISNLAITFARASQRTLLIDGDLRHPKIGRRFGLPIDQPGIVDFLAGQAKLEEILAATTIENLTVIPAGSTTVNPTELLGSEKMARLMDTLKQHFDVILFDSAPVLPVADSLMLTQYAETIILVVRSGITEKAVAQEALRRLRRVGANVRGLVLNDFDPGESGYSSDRYSVSSYGVVDKIKEPPPSGSAPDEPYRSVG